MRHCILLPAAFAAGLLGAVSCNADRVSPELENPSVCKLTVQAGSLTKVSGVNGLGNLENEVKTLQVLVFKDGYLEAYESGTSSSLTVSCTSGTKEVYAIVNGADCSKVLSKAELLSLKHTLGHYVSSPTELCFPMAGSKNDVSLPATQSVTIPVSRLVSRVEVDRIALEFNSEAFSEQTFTLDSIYFINAATSLGLGSDQGTDFINAKRFSQGSDREKFLTMEAVGSVIADKGADSTPRYLYTMPSGKTLLVLSARLGQKRFYYPLQTGPMESNASYRISQITIRRPGAEDPSTPVSFDDVVFGISVQPWEETTLPSENFSI